MMKNKHWTSRFFEMWYIAETQKWDSYVTTSFNNSIENHNGRQCWWGNIIEDFEVVDKNSYLGLLAWLADHENWIRVLGLFHFFIFYFIFKLNIHLIFSIKYILIIFPLLKSSQILPSLYPPNIMFFLSLFHKKI